MDFHTASCSSATVHPFKLNIILPPRSHHHKYPMDFDRLVFPPAAAAIVIALFYWLLHALLPMVGYPGLSPAPRKLKTN